MPDSLHVYTSYVVLFQDTAIIWLVSIYETTVIHNYFDFLWPAYLPVLKHHNGERAQPVFINCSENYNVCQFAIIL